MERGLEHPVDGDQGRRLLILDDDAPLRIRLAKAMEKRGFTVSTAESVSEALKIVSSQSHDYAVLDLWLKDGSGLDTVELLAREYIHLQAVIENFDDKTLIIKGWAVTVSFTVLAWSLKYNKRSLVFFSGASALFFWILEALWKTFSFAYIDRLKAIETAFRDSSFADIQPFQIQNAWWLAWEAGASVQFLRRLFFMNVILPYFVIILLCIII